MSKRWLSAEEAQRISARNRRGWHRDTINLDIKNPVGQLAKRGRLQHSLLPSENAECRAFIQWTELVTYRERPLFDYVVKVANERGKAGIMTAILTSIGMRKGFPDYIVLAQVPPHAGLFLEAKRRLGGHTDPEQISWRDDLIEFGYHAEICAGAAELIDATRRYFRGAAKGAFIDRTRGL